MTHADALFQLIECAYRHTPSDERLHILDAVASLSVETLKGCDAQHISGLKLAAATLAAQLRAADELQLAFEAILNPNPAGGKDGQQP